MSSVVLGIDPGLKGGYALIGPGDVLAEPFPLAGKSLDLAELAREWRSFELDLAVIERVHAMPKQGVTSMFTFGKTCGQIEGILAALGVPVEFVTPQAWKAAILAGTLKDKDAAVAYCRRVFPSVQLVRKGCRKASDGMADALCLAQFGKRELAT